MLFSDGRSRLSTFKILFIGLLLFATVNGQQGQQHYLQDATKELSKAEGIAAWMKAHNKTDRDTMTAIMASLVSSPFLKEVQQNALSYAERLETLGNSSYEVSPTCLNQTEMILQGITTTTPWALAMFDAMGKPSAGILGGDFNWVGSFDECEQIVDIYKGPYETKYCVASVNVAKASTLLPFGAPVKLGVCVPLSCSSSDVVALINTGIYAIPIINSESEVTVDCKEGYTEIDTTAFTAILITSILGLLMVLGTLYDMLVQNDYLPKLTDGREKYNLDDVNGAKEDVKPEIGIIGKLFLSFSIYTNGSKILNTSQPAGALTAVNGIRFISMSWVILGHTYAFCTSYVDTILYFYGRGLGRWTFQSVLNATFSVDSFFVLSGLLVSFITLKQMKKLGGAKKFPWGMYYFHRFWRLTPPYMLVLMVNVCLVRYLGNGPFWSQEMFDSKCSTYWWRNILYINNLFDDEGLACFGWSWYLANDMQFYVLSPLILVPLYYSTVFGSVVSGVLIGGCLIARGVISNHYDLSPGVMYTNHGGDYMLQMYVKPYTRIAPYVIGLLAGFVLFKTECKIRIPKMVNMICWTLAAGLALSCLYGLYRDGASPLINPLSEGVTALYNATSRTAWSVAVAWVIVACATGNGGFVNTLLSWSPFVPLGRLTYCAYLVHPVVMYWFYGSLKVPFNGSDTMMIYFFIGHLVLSYGLAFIVSLTFESPMMGLEKVLLGRGKKN